MSRIGSIGQLGPLQLRILNRIGANAAAMDQSSLRLSTLKRINSAKDDPAGLVRAQILDSSLNAVRAASASVVRAQGLLNTADTAASNIVSQLEEARTLALEVAGGTLDSSEIAANQNEIDTILDGINRLSKTDFNSQRLLDGSSGFRVSGVNSAQIKDVEVFSKATTSDVSVAMTVTTTALQGALDYDDGALAAAATLEINGPKGTATIELANGATTQEITDAFNAVSHLTGVTATRVDALDIDFKTTAYGSGATFEINALAGAFATTGTGTGRDAVATINGTSVTADGTVFDVSRTNINLRVEIAAAASGALTTFTVSGDGLEFRVTADPNDVARIGLADLSTSSLGGSTGKLYTLRSGEANALTEDNALTAIAVIDEALSEARLAQARIGGFSKYAIDSAGAMLNAQEENLTEAYGDIMDADVAEETARLSRNSMLNEAALQALQVSLLDNSHVLNLLQSAVVRI